MGNKVSKASRPQRASRTEPITTRQTVAQTSRLEDEMQPPEVSSNDASTYGSFCNLCAALISTWSSSPAVHHENFRSLEKSASAGCAMCRLFHYAVSQQRLNENGFDAVGMIKDPNERYRTGHLLTLHRRLDETKGGQANFQCCIAPSSNASSSSLCFKYQRVNKADGTILVEAALPIKSTIGRNNAGLDPIARPSDQVLLSDLAVCSKWLRDCIGHTLPAGSWPAHFACPVYREEKMPTRLLKISLPDHDGQVHIQLIESNGMVGAYVALSWCWGEMDCFKTTTENLEHHLQGIAYDSLPQTFKDAITVTRSLGYSYLWIDSLCIVQDDPRDWQRECSLMSSVYQRSAVTIAAATAENQHAGFLRFRQPHPPPDCLIPRRQMNPLKLTGSYCVTLPDVLNIRGKESERLPTSMLLQRGWCLQERLLSPRVLYFSDQEVWYDCSQGRFRERYPDACNKHASFSAGSDSLNQHGLSSNGGFASHPTDPLDLWLLVVAEFTICDVSYQSDLLPALSGLARTLHDRYEHSERRLGEYAAGIWMHERLFHRCLLWSARSGRKRAYRRPRESPLPSWSWASCDRPILHLQSQKDNEDRQCRVLSHKVETYGLDEYGDVKPGADLRLAGFLTHCTIDIRSYRVENTSGISQMTGIGSQWVELGHFSADDDDDWPDGSERDAFYLPVLGSEVHNDGLVVARLHDNVFRRLGVGWFHAELGTYKRGDWQEFTLM